MSARGPRWLALQNGDQFYHTDTPCARGHLAQRVATTGTCVDCRRLLGNARYAADPAAHRAVANRYGARNRELLAARTRLARASETPEKRSARLATSRLRSAAWRIANPAHGNTKEVKKAWKANNPGKVNAFTAKRRAALMQRTPCWLTPDDLWLMEQAYELAALRTKLFGFSWHVDHVVPLQGKRVSGLHTPLNLQVIPGFDNMRKANRFTAP